MILANDNFQQLPVSYLFSEVGRRIAEFKSRNPEAEVIRMDIGDVTLPLFPSVAKAMRDAIGELTDSATFRGYGPEQGYPFLRDAIALNDYRNRGIDISPDDIDRKSVV